MRKLASVSAVTVSALALLVPAAHAAVPGDDGTVKIHDAETGEDLVKNEPHVCTFYLDAFGFDEGQQVDWRIVGMPPTGSQDEVAESGSLLLDEDGHGRTDDMELPDGHYKLIWNFDGENGEAKHKVFWTDCEDEEEPGGGSSGTPSGSASPSASATPSEDPSEPAPSSSSSAGASTAPSAVPPTPNGGKSDLAETGAGAPVGAISGIAAALLAVGAGMVFFLRRKADGRH